MESSFECEVCMIVYNENKNRPRFLPCGHTLCSHCIQNSLRACNGRLTCPFCRTVSGPVVKTLEDFPTAFALLNLLDKKEPKKCSDALSPRDMENIEYLEKKQKLYDNSRSCISSCNEHLLILLKAKEIQETIIESIEIEQRKLEADKNKACAIRDKLATITKDGNEIVKKLEESQNRVKCSDNKSDLEKVADEAQLFCNISTNWISQRAKSIIEENAHLNPEVPPADEETNQSVDDWTDEWTVTSLSRDWRERTGRNSRGGLIGGRNEAWISGRENTTRVRVGSTGGRDEAWRRSGRDNTTRGRGGSIEGRGDEAWRASSRDNTTRGRGGFIRGRGDEGCRVSHGNNTTMDRGGSIGGRGDEGWRRSRGDNTTRGRSGTIGGRDSDRWRRRDEDNSGRFRDRRGEGVETTLQGVEGAEEEGAEVRIGVGLAPPGMFRASARDDPWSRDIY